MSLVRVRVGDREFNVGAAHAQAQNLEVLDEPTHNRDGSVRPATRTGGRPVKPRTTVAAAAAKKAAAKKTSARKPRAAKKAATSAASTDNPPSKEI